MRMRLILSVCMLCLWSVAAQAAGLRILATTFPVQQFTLNVCKDVPGVEIDLLIPASAGCPHDFALKPGDLRRLAQARVLVINGAGLEDFLDRMLASAPADLQLIDAGIGVELLEEPGAGHHRHANPHIFAAPDTAAKMVTNIARGLARQDPAHAGLYEDNARGYVAKLDALAGRLRKLGQKAANRNVALEHDALAYLLANAGLRVSAWLDPSSTAVQLAAIIRDLKKSPPALLIGDSQYPDRIAMSVSRETGIPLARLDACAGGPENASADYYIDVMNNNIGILEQKLD